MIEPDETLAPMRAWLAMPMETLARQAIERMRRGEDVVRIAVMPDVHLAGNFCVGAAVATRRLIYPAAVGGDIGCGMLAVAFNASADICRDAETPTPFCGCSESRSPPSGGIDRERCHSPRH